MSMNVQFKAARLIKVLSRRRGVVEKTDVEHDVEWFDVLQTPTDVSYKIAGAEDPFVAYREWVLSCLNKEDAENHIEAFNDWLQEMDKRGFHVQVEVL
ncbi:MAG: hypothetical protein ACOC3C_04115 [Candidatus Thorarchaeota archaeon]